MMAVPAARTAGSLAVYRRVLAMRGAATPEDCPPLPKDAIRGTLLPAATGLWLPVATGLRLDNAR
jgi:hypothetical protein